jgi:putative tryptophan/tyrosine transport system substrate-binding protein
MSIRRIKRREFVSALGGLFALPAIGRAQTNRMAHIVYLGATSLSSIDPLQLEQFRKGLAENGLVEGRNVTVEYLWGEGSLERLQRLAGELARRDLDVILTAGAQAVGALMDAHIRTPIVFAIYGNPTGNPAIQSLAHPGGNLTGLSMANAHLESKRLEILKEGFPGLKRVAILYDATSSSSYELDDAKAGARMLGVEPLFLEALDPSRFEAIFAEAVSRGADGLAGMASAILNFHHPRLIALAAQRRLPSIWESSGYVRDGGLLSYGPNFPDMYRRAAGYIARILKGEKASDLPIEQPVKFELAVNLKTAKALDLTIPATLLTRADEVIE